MRGFISDETPEKLYDGRLVARMAKYAKPFIWQMLGAFFLVIIMSGIELLNPYIQKLMIDNHIIFNNRYIYTQRMSEEQLAVFASDYMEDAYKVSDTLYIADPKNFVKKDALIWERDSIISQRKVFVSDTSSNSDKASIVVK